MHLGIIMDENRRWAEENGLPALGGHRKGAEKIRQVAEWCKKRGVKILTLYAFSTENWNRSKPEIDFLMKLFGEFLARELKELQKERLKFMVIGQKERLSVSLQKKIKEAEDLTKDYKEGVLILAISYGGRAEIAAAIKKMIQSGASPDDVTEEKIGA